MVYESMEDYLKRLKELEKANEDDSFEGVFVCSNGKGTWGRWNKGDAQDKVNAIDFIIRGMNEEPNEESRNYFMNELFKRWCHYFGTAYEQMMVRGLVK